MESDDPSDEELMMLSVHMEPTFSRPIIEVKEPNRTQVLSDTVEPKLENAKMEQLLPTRASVRTLIVEPSVMKDTVEMPAFRPPKDAQPRMLILEPMDTN